MSVESDALAERHVNEATRERGGGRLGCKIIARVDATVTFMFHVDTTTLSKYWTNAYELGTQGLDSKAVQTMYL